MFIDDWIEGALTQPCPICGDDDSEDALLLCAGCAGPSHTFCLGLDSVPSTPWYCHQCETQRVASSEPAEPRPQGRTRAEQRRQRNRNQMNDDNWARVWQTVFSQLNLDLDFPFDDDEVAEIRQFQEAQRREFSAWERRLQVARRQGGAQTFRETAPALLEMRRGWPSRPRPRVETPEPETVDEVKAWDAFERAREIENEPNSNRLKRKSPSPSPAELEPEPAQPERRLKRPRTRRPEALAERLERGGPSRPLLLTASRTQADASGPSFLQSLLKDVEDASGSSGSNGTFRSTIPAPAHGDMSSPRPSSPALSPASSSRSSPRLSSPTPPPYGNGPASPMSVCSDFNFSSPELSPTFSPSYGARPGARRSRQLDRPQYPQGHSSSVSPSRHRSNESSPTRSSISPSLKSDLQKMVRTALKPHYYQKLITKDDFIDINKRISRQLYELVGSSDGLNSESRIRWEKVASDEVNNAVAQLKDVRGFEAGESSGAASS